MAAAAGQVTMIIEAMLQCDLVALHELGRIACKVSNILDTMEEKLTLKSRAPSDSTLQYLVHSVGTQDQGSQNSSC